MAADIHELRASHRSTLDEMQAILDAAEADDRDLTDQETSDYDELNERAQKYERRISRLQAFREQRDNAPEIPQSEGREIPSVTARDYDETDFRSLAEFTQAVVLNPRDQRLRGQYIEVEDVEQRDTLQMGTDTLGGYLVPEQFMTDILEFQARGAVIRPRATVIQPGGPADAKVKIPVLDQSGTKGVYSGVVVQWISEGAAKPETNPTFDQIELEPYEVAAHTVITDKQLRNAPVTETIVRRLLTGGITAAEDVAYISGDGVGKPTGFIGHASNIAVNRTTANDVTFADLVEMYSRMIFGGNPVWLATQRALPRLMSIEDTEGHLVWQQSMRDGVPATIFGFPVVVSNRLPALGEEGDVSFVDLEYYLIKDGSPLALAASEHVRFLSNETVIKAFKLTDGRPWPNTPLQDENGELVSPFVVLDEPAG